MIILVEKNAIQEKRVPASKQEFARLKAQIKTSPMLQKQLTVPMQDIEQYRWIYLPGWQGELTLFHGMELIYRESKSVFEFIKSGNSFTGFVTYMDDGQLIWGIKMASFFDDKIKANRQLVVDLLDLINEKMKDHDRIEWWAESGNPANKMYPKVLPDKFPQYVLTYGWDKKVNKYLYRVSKK